MISFTGDHSSQGKICEFKREFSANGLHSITRLLGVIWSSEEKAHTVQAPWQSEAVMKDVVACEKLCSRQTDFDPETLWGNPPRIT